MSLTLLEAAEAGLSTIEHLNYLMKAGSRDEAAISADYLAAATTTHRPWRATPTASIPMWRCAPIGDWRNWGVMASPTQHGSSTLVLAGPRRSQPRSELAYIGPGIRGT